VRFRNLLSFTDDLPIWGIVGEMEEKENSFYIWTHKKFEIGYNEDQVLNILVKGSVTVCKILISWKVIIKRFCFARDRNLE